MILTDITETKKGRYALFCDNEFIFSIDEETFFKHSLYRGMELDESLLSSLKENSDLMTARSKALELLLYRTHSKKELYDKLCKRYDALTAQAVTEDIERMGYINDNEYAKECIEYLFKRKNLSIRAATNYLYERGISKDISESLLLEYEDSEVERIKAVIEKKYLNDLKKSSGYNKVFSALSRRGFSSGDIREVLKQTENDE